MNGALLENGTQVHLPPNQAWSLGNDLAAGQTLIAQGYGASGPYGRSLDAQQIGPSATQLVQVGPPGPPGRGRPAPPPPAGFGAPLPPGGPAAPPPPLPGRTP
jgi:hypothetical protein